MVQDPNNNRPTIGVINTIYEGAPSSSSLGYGLDKLPEEPSTSKWAWLHDMITFFEDDLKKVWNPHDDPIVISLTIFKYDIKWILVDNESSADILFYDAF